MIKQQRGMNTVDRDEYIANPRPLFKDEGDLRGKKILVIGGATAGIVVIVSKKGLELNGYYAGLVDPVKFANMREYSLITWDDLDKMRANIFKRKPRKKKAKKEANTTLPEAAPVKLEKPDKKYLESLPIVHMNGKPYYMDVDKGERRPVSNPEQVVYFRELPDKKPT